MLKERSLSEHHLSPLNTIHRMQLGLDELVAGSWLNWLKGSSNQLEMFNLKMKKHRATFANGQSGKLIRQIRSAPSGTCPFAPAVLADNPATLN